MDFRSEKTELGFEFLGLCKRENGVCLHLTTDKVNRFPPSRFFPGTEGITNPPIVPKTMVKQPAIVIASKKLRNVS